MAESSPCIITFNFFHLLLLYIHQSAKAINRATQSQVYYKDNRVNRIRELSDDQKEAKKIKDREYRKRKRAQEEPQVRTDADKAKRTEAFRVAREEKLTKTIHKQTQLLKRPRAPAVESAALLKRANHSAVNYFFNREGERDRLQDMALPRLGVVVAASEMLNLERRAHKAPGDTSRGSGRKKNGRKQVVQLLHDTSHDVSQVIILLS